MRWQEKVQKHERVVVKGCRRSGKTYGALKWAAQAGSRVLMVVPFTAGVTHAKYTAEAIFQDEIIEILRTSGGIAIKLKGDRLIWVVSHTLVESTRGLRVDAVVVDEAQRLDEEHIYNVLATMMTGTVKFFVTYTSALMPQEKKNIMAWERLKPHRVTIDYLDLLEAGVLYASHIRELHGSMSAYQFEQEMGPFKREKNEGYTNEDFRFLLSEQA